VNGGATLQHAPQGHAYGATRMFSMNSSAVQLWNKRWKTCSALHSLMFQNHNDVTTESLRSSEARSDGPFEVHFLYFWLLRVRLYFIANISTTMQSDDKCDVVWRRGVGLWCSQSNQERERERERACAWRCLWLRWHFNMQRLLKPNSVLPINVSITFPRCRYLSKSTSEGWPVASFEYIQFKTQTWNSRISGRSMMLSQSFQPFVGVVA